MSGNGAGTTQGHTQTHLAVTWIFGNKAICIWICTEWCAAEAFQRFTEYDLSTRKLPFQICFQYAQNTFFVTFDGNDGFSTRKIHFWYGLSTHKIHFRYGLSTHKIHFPVRFQCRNLPRRIRKLVMAFGQAIHLYRRCWPSALQRHVHRSAATFAARRPQLVYRKVVMDWGVIPSTCTSGMSLQNILRTCVETQLFVTGAHRRRVSLRALCFELGGWGRPLLQGTVSAYITPYIAAKVLT